MSEKFAVVETFPVSPPAEIARARLEAEGIRAYIEDAAAVDAYSVMSTAMGGVKLKVAESDLERARKALTEAALGSGGDPLDELDVGKPSDDVVDDIDPDTAARPIIEEAPPNATEALAKRWLLTAFFGSFFPPLLLYAAWLGFRYVNAMEPIRPKYSKHVYGAAALTVVMLLVWYKAMFGRYEY